MFVGQYLRALSHCRGASFLALISIVETWADCLIATIRQTIRVLNDTIIIMANNLKKNRTTMSGILIRPCGIH